MNLDDCTFRLYYEFPGEVVPSQDARICYLHYDSKGFDWNSGEGGDVSARVHMCFHTKVSTEDTFHVLPPDATFQTQLRILRAFAPKAEEYVKSFDSFKDMTGNEDERTEQSRLTTFLNEHNTLLKGTKKMLQVMISSCVIVNNNEGASSSAEILDEDYIKLTGTSRKDFQDLARESKTLDVLMCMIMAPLNCKHAGVSSIRKWEQKDDSFQKLRMLQDHCFKLMRCLIEGNEDTELYIAAKYCAQKVSEEKSAQSASATKALALRHGLEWPWNDYAEVRPGSSMVTETWVHCIIVCAAHLPSAQACLSTLLSNNEELLDRFVDHETIESFIGNIQEKGPESATMDFFRAICSCKGHQILSNQELCLRKLLHDSDKRIQLCVETTVFPVEMFDFVDNRRHSSSPTFKDFIKDYDGMPDLKVIFDQAMSKKGRLEHEGKLELEELRSALKTLHVELTRRDIKFVLERVTDDGLVDFNDFKYFIVTHLHPEWEIGFVRTAAYAKTHKRLKNLEGVRGEPRGGLKKQQWEYATEDLVKKTEKKDGKIITYPYRQRVKNQYMHYTSDADDKGSENKAYQRPLRYLGDANEGVEDEATAALSVGDLVTYSEDWDNQEKPKFQARITKVDDSQLFLKLLEEGDGSVMERMQSAKSKSSRALTRQETASWVRTTEEVKASRKQIQKRVVKFDPVFVGWTGLLEWEPGHPELYFSPSALGLVDDEGVPYEAVQNSGVLKGSESRAWVPIERICWVLDPKKLFVKVMLPKVITAMESEDLKPDSVEDTNRDLVVEKTIKEIYDPIFNKDGECEIHVGEGEFHAHDKRTIKLWWYEIRSDLITFSSSPAVVRFDMLHRIASYYLAQISLFAEMCLDRSYNSIYEMQRQFTFDMLVSLVGNPLLPDSIRSGFTLLLLRTFIDRYPHAPIQAPGPVQVFEDSEGSAAEMVILDVDDLDGAELKRDQGNQGGGKFGILPQFYIPRDGPLSKGRVGTNMNLSSLKFLMFGISPGEAPGDKFFLVEEFITSYLLQLGGQQNPENTEENRFVLSILELVQALVRFGFYGTYYELMDVTTPLVEILNGSKDMDDKRARYSVETPGNKLVMDSKMAIVKSLMDLNRIRDDYRQKIILAYFKQSLGKIENDNIKDINEEMLLFPSILADKIRKEEERKKMHGADDKALIVSLPDLVKREQAVAKEGLSRMEEEFKKENQRIMGERKKMTPNEDTEESGAPKAATSASSPTTRLRTHSAQSEQAPGYASVEWVLSSYCQHRINDIFEEIEDKNLRGTALKTHNYGLLDLDTMSPTENLNAICMDLMMYDSPELFECAFSLLWSQFAQRQVKNSLQLVHHDHFDFGLRCFVGSAMLIIPLHRMVTFTASRVHVCSRELSNNFLSTNQACGERFAGRDAPRLAAAVLAKEAARCSVAHGCRRGSPRYLDLIQPALYDGAREAPQIVSATAAPRHRSVRTLGET